MATSENDLISVIISDHRAFERTFQELENGGGSSEHRRDLADNLIAELMRHSVAEEQHMYPAAREALDDGDEVVDHELEEHAEAEQIMKELEGVEATDDRFDELVSKLIGEVRHHLEEEEENLLPRLQAACSADQLRELGYEVLRAKESASTRPQP